MAREEEVALLICAKGRGLREGGTNYLCLRKRRGQALLFVPRKNRRYSWSVSTEEKGGIPICTTEEEGELMICVQGGEGDPPICTKEEEGTLLICAQRAGVGGHS